MKWVQKCCPITYLFDVYPFCFIAEIIQQTEGSLGLRGERILNIFFSKVNMWMLPYFKNHIHIQIKNK